MSDQTESDRPSEEQPATLAECQQALQVCQETSEQRRQELLRAHADLDNMHKRATREIEKAHKYAVSRLLEALLPVKDSLELGMQAADSAPDVETLRRGMQMTLEKFEVVLGDFGVEAVDPKGQPFDPKRHEAMTMAPVYDLPPNSVAEVHQKGYKLNGRLIRPARVTVSKKPHEQQD